MSYKKSEILKVKETVASWKNIINFLIITCAILSIAYLMYWGAVISDDIIYDSTKNVFLPLAHFFFPNETDYIMYRNTSFCFALLIIPCFFVQYILDKIEEETVKKEKVKEEINSQKIIEQSKKEQLIQYEIIKTYSICLSIDYDGKRKITNENKNVLNNQIFKKITTKLFILDKTAKAGVSDVLIFTSSDFSKYDLIYDAIINSLANISKVFEKNHDIKLIPSITTDAFCNEIELNKIRKSHFEIQSFNHKNRALSSAMFAKKYKHLNHKKYAGIPIGEYAYFKNNKVDTYDLNVIHKNLTTTLSKVMG